MLQGFSSRVSETLEGYLASTCWGTAPPHQSAGLDPLSSGSRMEAGSLSISTLLNFIWHLRSHLAWRCIGGDIASIVILATFIIRIDAGQPFREPFLSISFRIRSFRSVYFLRIGINKPGRLKHRTVIYQSLPVTSAMTLLASFSRAKEGFMVVVDKTNVRIAVDKRTAVKYNLYLFKIRRPLISMAVGDTKAFDLYIYPYMERLWSWKYMLLTLSSRC